MLGLLRLFDVVSPTEIGSDIYRLYFVFGALGLAAQTAGSVIEDTCALFTALQENYYTSYPCTCSLLQARPISQHIDTAVFVCL